MKTHVFCLIALAVGASSSAQTTLPEVPSLTIGPVIKGLQFDWEPVAGASWYQLEIKAAEKSQFVQYGYDYDASVTSLLYHFPLHRYFWTPARYRLAACNISGCTRSAEVSVSSLRRFAVGYFKPKQTQSEVRFASDIAMSGDGKNFVSTAPGELVATSAGPRPGGAIYIFRRNAGLWRERVRLEPSAPPFIGGDNVMKVAISADGFTVALGMPNYFHAQSDAQSGEVFVFRLSGTQWLRTRIRAGARGQFGRWVALSDAGDTLAIAHGERANPSLPPKIAIYKLLDGVWQPVRDIGDRFGRTEFCDQGVLSGDGSTVAESCHENAAGSVPARTYVRTHSGTNWTTRRDLPLEMSVSGGAGHGHGAIAIDGNGTYIAAQVFVAPDGPAEVHVFEREEDGEYEKEATLTPGAWRDDAQRHFFGQSLAISGNGLVLAVGDSHDNGLGLGPRAAPLNPGVSRTGAVYVYRYYDDWWNLYNMVKPNYHPDDAPYLTFGSEVALSTNGISLIVGESGESSNAVGIAGDWHNIEAPGAGAVWLY
jgi:hypothetical protein